MQVVLRSQEVEIYLASLAKLRGMLTIGRVRNFYLGIRCLQLEFLSALLEKRKRKRKVE